MGSKVLVIDDDREVRQTLRLILEQDGYEVTCVEDGAKGIASAKRDRPDIVITDLIMPEKEGLETIMALRSDGLSEPIIAISGGGRMNSTDLLHMAAALGADAVIEKPFDPDALLETIKRCLPAERRAVGC